LIEKYIVSKMPELMVTGGRRLQGRIKISGAKNAVLPQMAASLLTREKVTLTNVPDITDVRDMKSTLEAYGVAVKWDKPNSTLVLQAGMSNVLSSCERGQDFSNIFQAIIHVRGNFKLRFRFELYCIFKSETLIMKRLIQILRIL
jgi:UDP-N-acetylglucosamine 1-carboxyvinyltransferase